MKKINNWRKTLAAALIMVVPITSSAAVKIYSAPEGIEASGDFAVSVGGQNAFVFSVAENGLRKSFLPAAERMALGEDENEKKAAVKSARESWVSFETAASAPISIAQLAGAEPLENVLLIDQLGQPVPHTVAGTDLSFTAVAGNKYVLILNADLSRRLTIFAEKPEQDVPDMNGPDTFVIQPGTPRADYEKTAKKTLYFAPGLHEMGNAFPLKPGLQIYLAPGAYVRGYFTCPPGADSAGASGVKIFGRGILSSEYNQASESVNGNFLPRPIGFWSNSIYLGGFNREPADNQIVQGITIIYASQQPIMGNGSKTLVENVKIINFHGCPVN